MRGRLSVRVAMALAAVAVVAYAAGCGEEVLDSAKVGDQVQSDLEQNLPKVLARGALGAELQKQLGIARDEKIDSVDCESDVEIEPKTTFSCEATFANGRQATATFKILDEDANVEQVSFKPKLPNE